MGFQRVLSINALMVALIMIAATPCLASGYIGVDNTGQPYKWAGDIVLRFDQGPLGSLSKAEADDLTLTAMHAWMEPNITGSTVHFVRGPDLDEDHGDGFGDDPAWDLNPPHDGITPVIYDQTGALLDSELGAGASDSVVGAADVYLPADRSPATLTEGILVMNGKMIGSGGGLGGGLPIDHFLGAIIHELGHLINLGHSQAALAFTATGYDLGSPLAYLGETPPFTPDYRGMPTMFPTVLPELQTLEMDDIAWMKSLYGDSNGQPLGSISGTISNFDGTPFNGANVVAYSVDDYTSMVTCVSGFSDVDPVGNPTGKYTIPGLPVGSKWILDVEPIVPTFAGGSIVGPIDPPPPLAGMPEFVNEVGIESGTDQPSLSTTFAITSDPAGLNITDANLQFNDPADIDIITETDTGTDEHAGQVLNLTPGRMMFVNGVADPAEPNPQVYGLAGVFVLAHIYDFFTVNYPAGLELNYMLIDFDGSYMDAFLFSLSNTEDSQFITSTGSTGGQQGVSLYVDSFRVGLDEANRGTFSFGVGFSGKDIGGSDPYELTTYSLVLAFAVSDRDALALGGTASGEINPDSGTIQVTGRGFKNIGGPPTVTFDSPGIIATSVTYIDENTLDVAIEKAPGFTPGETTMQVMNQVESGGYGGRIKQITTGTPSSVVGWELY